MEECTNAKAHWYPFTNQRRLFARLRDGTIGEQRRTFHWQHNHQINCAGTLILCKVECSLLMYAEKQALYISSLVRPTFRTYVVGKLAMYPSSMASVTSAIEPSAAVIYKDSNAMTATWVAGLIKKVCPHWIQHRPKTIVTTDHRH